MAATTPELICQLGTLTKTGQRSNCMGFCCLGWEMGEDYLDSGPILCASPAEFGRYLCLVQWGPELPGGL